MTTKFKFPETKAAIYWPIGTGDSTTLILRPDEIVMQIDLRHLEKADDDDNPEWPIVDYLVELLPKVNGKPYLAAFVLTHPDKDHIQGFAELLRRVHIGELWHTPRIFRDQADEEQLCDDAKAFRKEAQRRRKALANNPDNIKSGDRLRVIGHDDILNEDEYSKLPEDCKSRPAEIVRLVNGVDLTGHFKAFIHAPFKDDQAKSKNNTSLSLNILIQEGAHHGQFMFFGDREYLTIKRIYELSEERGNSEYLYADVLLSAHHCSKAVMYWKGEGEGEATFKKDMMDYFENYRRAGYFIASSLSEFTDGDGDNPPHKRARNRYEEIADAGKFICTHEYPTMESPEPLVFTVGPGGFKIDDKRKQSAGPKGLSAAVAGARGTSSPPRSQTTFGTIQ